MSRTDEDLPVPVPTYQPTRADRAVNYCRRMTLLFGGLWLVSIALREVIGR